MPTRQTMSWLGQPLPSATGFSISNPCPNLHGYLPCRASTTPMALRAMNGPEQAQQEQPLAPSAQAREAAFARCESRHRVFSSRPNSKRGRIMYAQTLGGYTIEEGRW